jgi:hypothetical protein
MPEQEPGFKVPEAANRMSEKDLDLLLPKSESGQELTFITVRSEYIAAAAVKARPRRQPAQKRTQAPRK